MSEDNGNKIDPSIITVEQIDWFRLHVLSLTYNRDLGPINEALSSSLDSAIGSLRDAESSQQDLESISRKKAAAHLIGLTKIFFDFYGTKALDMVEAKYLTEEIIPDHIF